uniref:Uncharacterized protein n=1 Tax=Oryctolagus cuniculus TaxID=9986 RepID=A0A5F9CV49_RABIT
GRGQRWDAECTLFLGNLETTVTQELLLEPLPQEVVMPRRLSVCRSPSTVLKPSLRIPYSSGTKGLWITSLRQHGVHSFLFSRGLAETSGVERCSETEALWWEIWFSTDGSVGIFALSSAPE